MTWIVLALLCLSPFVEAAPRPVVMWHGMGDNCCFDLNVIKKLIEIEIPGIFVHSIEIGNNTLEDTINGFFMPIHKQIPYAMEQLIAIPQLADGFNALGFSQGGQFLRAFVQQYNYPPVHNLITLGAQHQGREGRFLPTHSLIRRLRYASLPRGKQQSVRGHAQAAGHWRLRAVHPGHIGASAVLARRAE